jgi:hypothetical protein
MQDDSFDLQKKELDAIRQGRELLLLQIKQSQETIERSQELLKRMDELLTKTSRS